MADHFPIVGVKFRLWPTPEQAQTLARWMGCQRHIYNAKVEEDRCFYSQRKLAIRHGEEPPKESLEAIDQAYARHKDPELTPWLSDVPSVVLRNAATRWHETKWRALKGECGHPTKKRRGGRQSALLTSELFEFKPFGWRETAPKGSRNEHRLHLGTKKFPVGFVEFTAHRDYREPKQITISKDATGWWLSFCFEGAPEDWALPDTKPWWATGVHPDELRSEQELLYELSLLDEKELSKRVLGIDRGVANPMCGSDGVFRAMDPVVVERIKRKEIGAKRQQRKLARQQKGSKNSRKTKAKIGTKLNYAKRASLDWAEKETTAIADDRATQAVVLESLNIKGMTKSPEAKQDEKTCKFLPNGAAAKAGLNKAILGSAWGLVEQLLATKLPRRNKVLVKVPAKNSSRECSECGDTRASNRPKQAVFECQACKFKAHADANASTVVKKRGVKKIRSGDARAEALARTATKNPKGVEQTGPGRPGVLVERSRELRRMWPKASRPL